MQVAIKIFSALLLLINGIGAIYGGLNLILHPDGSSIQLSLSWLQHTPFHDYLIPGIILLIANGIFSIITLIAVLFNLHNYPLLVMTQGAILTGWIIIQILLIQTIYFLHIILGSIGIALMVTGCLHHIYIETAHAANKLLVRDRLV